MASLTFARIAELTGGIVDAGGEVETTRVVIDSREADERSVFFAIRGERHDGHSFLDSALERALGAVVDRPVTAAPGKGIVRVSDTTTALQALATGVRRTIDPQVAGVTGSAGKTTTKEMLATLVETERRTWRTVGNFNNHIGLPLSLANTPDDTEAIIAEMGMSGPGEIALLARIAEPDLGVYTTIQPVHIEFFDSVDQIAAAKRELLENMRQDGTVVINANDRRVVAIAEGFPGRIVSYGVEVEADYRAENIQLRGLLGSTFDLVSEGETRAVELSQPGRFNLENLLAAIAGARSIGISWDGVMKGIGRVRPARHRGELVEINGYTLYDDTYNSNPHALSGALELLAKADSNGRRIAVIGDMLELGRNEKKFHYDAGNLAPSSIDAIVAVGERSRSVLEGAIDAGFDRANLFHFTDAVSAAEFLRTFLGEDDLVLLKASRGIGLDRVIEILRGNG